MAEKNTSARQKNIYKGNDKEMLKKRRCLGGGEETNNNKSHNKTPPDLERGGVEEEKRVGGKGGRKLCDQKGAKQFNGRGEVRRRSSVSMQRKIRHGTTRPVSKGKGLWV